MRTSPYKSTSYKHKKKISIVKHDTIGDYKIGPKIGQGTFSKVCQGIHIPTGEKVAIKILPKNQIKEKNDRIRIEKEISLQKKLHHQNIIQQYSILDTEKSIYIITEYCSGGELFDYIVSKRRLQEIEACRIYQQLINGLEYLHKQKICHRDLKPENLLFDSKHNLKIADFGLSNDYVFGKLSTPCGSPCYAAPEMVTGRQYYGDTVDIWSSGIVLYSMVCGYLPFEDDNQSVLFNKIAKGLFTMPSFLSNSCKDLIKNILITNPSKRYGFQEIKKHPWFMSVNNIGGKNILFTSPGIVIDYDVIPIDIDIIKEIYFTKAYKNFSILNIVNDVIRDKHNKITTAYYLILRKKLRNNEESISNINSNSKLFIDYIKKPISKMEYWDNNYDKIIDYYTNKVKEEINKEKELKKRIEQDKKKMTNKNKVNDLEILYTDNDIVNYNDISDASIEAQINKNFVDTNIVNDDFKLSTIVYDDEEKDLLKMSSSNRKPKERKRHNSYQKEPEENYLKYKMNNYELDSDEPIIKDIYDTPTNKKQFYDMTNENENEKEENEINNSLNSDNNELFNKIIKNDEIKVEFNGITNNIKGRNKVNNIGGKTNNSVCEVKPKNINIKDLILSDKKKYDNKNILITETYNNKNYCLSNDKSNKKDSKTKIIKINENKKEKPKKKKLNMQKCTLPNNSYLYKKIASMIDKDDKVLKFINKKKSNIKNENNNNYVKIDGIIKNNNKKNQSLEYRNNKSDINNLNLNNQKANITNGQKESNELLKINEKIELSTPRKNNNNKNNNNLKVNDINKLYNKLNAINNAPNYRKDKDSGKLNKNLNEINKNYKYIITNPNRNNFTKINNNNFCINSSIKNKKHFNNSQNNNNNHNSLINKYLITENNYKIYKKSCPNQKSISERINNNNNGNSKNKINPVLLSEISIKHRKIINGSSLEQKNRLNPIFNQIVHGPRINSLDKNFLKYDKAASRIKIKTPPKIQNGSNSVEIKDVKSNNLINKFQIQSNHLEITNTYYSNGSNENISLEKEKTPKNKNIITEYDNKANKITENNYNTNYINKKTHKKISNNEGKNAFKFLCNDNNRELFSKKNIKIYYKKFLNLNKRYNNSAENDARQRLNKNKQNFILELLASNSNNYQYNNSVILLNKNKNKLKKNNHINKNKNNFINNFINNPSNINNNYHKSSVQNIKSVLRNYHFSQENEKKKLNLGNSAFNIPLKSKKVIKNNNNYLNVQHNKPVKKENIKISNISNEKKIIDHVNKIPSAICCKCPIDKIKNTILKVYMKKMNLINDKNYPMITVTSLNSSFLIKCRCVNKLFNLSFELNISPFNDVKNYVLIKPNLIKGNRMAFVDLFQKIKNEILR